MIGLRVSKFMGHMAEASLQQIVIGNCTAGKCRDRCLSNQTTNRVVYEHRLHSNDQSVCPGFIAVGAFIVHVSV